MTFADERAATKASENWRRKPKRTSAETGKWKRIARKNKKKKKKKFINCWTAVGD